MNGVRRNVKRNDGRVPRELLDRTFVQRVHNSLISTSTSAFSPDATERITQEVVTPRSELRGFAPIGMLEGWNSGIMGYGNWSGG